MSNQTSLEDIQELLAAGKINDEDALLLTLLENCHRCSKIKAEGLATTPSFDLLGLETGTVLINEQGVPEWKKTSSSIAGDVTGRFSSFIYLAPGISLRNSIGHTAMNARNLPELPQKERAEKIALTEVRTRPYTSIWVTENQELARCAAAACYDQEVREEYRRGLLEVHA